jgi:pantetheine-phosphate adenylyltransferase
MKIAVFPGSFDPFTLGHEDIVLRALPLFDKVIVAIGINSSKKYFYTLEERIDFIKSVFANHPKVEVATYETLTTHFCQSQNAGYILRGVRNSADFEYENTIAQLNRIIGKGIETVFLMTSPQHSFISSTIVREIIRAGEDVSPFLPAVIVQKIKS